MFNWFKKKKVTEKKTDAVWDGARWGDSISGLCFGGLDPKRTPEEIKEYERLGAQRIESKKLTEYKLFCICCDCGDVRSYYDLDQGELRFPCSECGGDYESKKGRAIMKEIENGHGHHVSNEIIEFIPWVKKDSSAKPVQK